MAKSRSQPVNVPGARPLTNPLATVCLGFLVVTCLAATYKMACDKMITDEKSF